ncbi:hypothetical protein WJX74_007154 [Apatococcus lobatus]|uniref:RING-type domain-containing protein n=1 Tax=Apatococcus lobatus TaxID=904363 RepID=A0AAW1SA38_9CHLO
MLEAMLPEDPWDLMQQAKIPAQLGHRQGLSDLKVAQPSTRRSFSLWSTPSSHDFSADAEGSLLDSAAMSHSADLSNTINDIAGDESCLSLTMLEKQLQSKSKQTAIWSYNSKECTPDVKSWARPRALSPPAPPAHPSLAALTGCRASYTTLSAHATPFQPAMMRTGSGQASEASSSGSEPVPPQTPCRQSSSGADVQPHHGSWESTSEEDLQPSTPDQATDSYYDRLKHKVPSPWAWMMSKACSHKYNGRQWQGNVLGFHQSFAMSVGERGMGSLGAAIMSSRREELMPCSTCLECSKNIPEVVCLPCGHMVTCVECQKSRGSSLACPYCYCCVREYDFIPADA